MGEPEVAGGDRFDELGAHLERAWAAADRDEERFPDLAAEALTGFADAFDREAFFTTLLDPARAGRQHLAPLGAFGQPGFTAFHGEGFVVEVYVWSDSLSAIHNHPFCGAFTILEGFSVHARYRCSRPTRAGARGQLLDVRLDTLELLERGAIERFSLRRHPLIHALVHVPVPSISMVVRTTRTEGYFRYLPPSLALPMEALPEPAARRVALLEALFACGDERALHRIADALRSADFETSVQLLMMAWPTLDEPQRESLWEANAALHGDRRDAIERALQRSRRLAEASALRTQLRDPNHRLCATAFAYAEQRSHVLSLLEHRGDPCALLHAFVDHAGLFTADEAPSADIAHALIDGCALDRIFARLVERYGEDAIGPERPAIEAYVRDSIFSVLAI